MYKVLARGTLVLHVTIFVWIFGGGIAVWFLPAYVPVHFWVMVLALGLQIAYKWQCVLTILEKRFLGQWDPERVYAGACARHYAKRWFGINIPAKWIAGALVIVFVWTLALYVHRIVYQ